MEAHLPALRAVTGQAPQVFLPELTSLLAKAGAALVICSHFPGTHASTAARSGWAGARPRS